MSSAAGGCDTNFTFQATTSTGAALKYPNQLKSMLRFADQTNPYINFKNLGNGKISIDPTYGLNDLGTGAVNQMPAAARAALPRLPSTHFCVRLETSAVAVCQRLSFG